MAISIEDEWEDFYLYYCQNCPYQDVCVIHPEEYEDECPRYRNSRESPKSAPKVNEG